MRDLNYKELLEINGGDEPAFGLGYLFGKAVKRKLEQLLGKRLCKLLGKLFGELLENHWDSSWQNICTNFL